MPWKAASTRAHVCVCARACVCVSNPVPKGQSFFNTVDVNGFQWQKSWTTSVSIIVNVQKSGAGYFQVSCRLLLSRWCKISSISTGSSFGNSDNKSARPRNHALEKCDTFHAGNRLLAAVVTQQQPDSSWHLKDAEQNHSCDASISGQLRPAGTSCYMTARH